MNSPREPDAPAAAIAEQDAHHAGTAEAVRELCVLRGAAPRRERREERRMDRSGLVLHAVARPVEVSVLVGVERLQRSLPRPHVFVEEAEDASRRMEAQ